MACCRGATLVPRPGMPRLTAWTATAATWVFAAGCSVSAPQPSLSPGADTTVYEVSSVDRRPKFQRYPSLAYPDSLRRAARRGVVHVQLVVDANGRALPGSVEVLSTPHPSLATATEVAIGGTLFRPARLGKHTVSVRVRMVMDFASGTAFLPRQPADTALLTEARVDQPPEVLWAPMPHYPDRLRSAGVQGTVLVQVVIDTTGRPEPDSFEIVRSPHADFDASVLAIVKRAKFRPARLGGRAVRAVWQLPVVFLLES